MTATETLTHEHEVILLALQGAEEQARQLACDPKQAAALIQEMAGFFRDFADRCHHAKEEKLLFPLLEQRGMPREGGPLGVMLAEHEQGRSYVRAILEALPGAAAGEGDAVCRVRDNLLAYVALLREHIDKENHCLFPMANEILSPADQAGLSAAFERVEIEEIGAGVHERYHELAHQWAMLARHDWDYQHEGGCRACGACRG